MDYFTDYLSSKQNGPEKNALKDLYSYLRRLDKTEKDEDIIKIFDGFIQKENESSSGNYEFKDRESDLKYLFEIEHEFGKMRNEICYKLNETSPYTNKRVLFIGGRLKESYEPKSEYLNLKNLLDYGFISSFGLEIKAEKKHRFDKDLFHVKKEVIFPGDYHSPDRYNKFEILDVNPYTFEKANECRKKNPERLKKFLINFLMDEMILYEQHIDL